MRAYNNYLEKLLNENEFADWVGRRPEEINTNIGKFIVTQSGRIRTALHKTIKSAESDATSFGKDCEIWKWNGKGYEKVI